MVILVALHGKSNKTVHFFYTIETNNLLIFNLDTFASLIKFVVIVVLHNFANFSLNL